MCFAITPYHFTIVFCIHIVVITWVNQLKMIKFAKIVHVLNFKTTTYLIIKQLQRVYENQSIVFPEWKRSAKARVLRGSRQKYRNTFYCGNDQIVMLKSEALREDDLNSFIYLI